MTTSFPPAPQPPGRCTATANGVCVNRSFRLYTSTFMCVRVCTADDGGIVSTLLNSDVRSRTPSRRREYERCDAQESIVVRRKYRVVTVMSDDDDLKNNERFGITSRTRRRSVSIKRVECRQRVRKPSGKRHRHNIDICIKIRSPSPS